MRAATTRAATEAALALILIGRARREKADYPAALESFQQQLQIARNLQDREQVTLSLQGMGSVLEAQERWPEALVRGPTDVKPVIVFG